MGALIGSILIALAALLVFIPQSSGFILSPFGIGLFITLCLVGLLLIILSIRTPNRPRNR